MTTGEILLQIMEEKNISKSELSRRTNISFDTITRMTRGNLNGSLYSWNIICNALGIKVDEVINGRN